MTLSRPMYETAEDLTEEAKVLDLCCDVWKCKWEKTPKSYPFDSVFLRDGEVRAFAEVKCRKFPSTRFPTTIINLDKWISLRQFHKETNLPTVLIIGFSDGVIRFLWINEDIEPKVISGERKGRNDPQDRQPWVEFDLSIFSRLN